jgi:hypothetical protein
MSQRLGLHNLNIRPAKRIRNKNKGDLYKEVASKDSFKDIRTAQLSPCLVFCRFSGLLFRVPNGRFTTFLIAERLA